MAQENQPSTQQASVAVEQPPVPPAKPSTSLKLPPLNKWTMIRIAVFVILGIWTVINFALLWANGITPQGIIMALWWPAIFWVQYAVFTTPWRAVTLKDLAKMFLIGMGLVFFAAYWGEILLTNIITAYPDINPLYRFITLDFVLGRGVNVMADVASPFMEESMKILPVLIFLFFAGRGYWKRALGPLDVALLGGASGAGFLFMENIARFISGYTDKIGPFRTVSIASPGFNPFYIFPDMYHGGSSVWMGHPEATMFVGLALGYGMMIRKKFPVWPIIPLVAFIWVTWLHFMINGFDTAGNAFWGQIVSGLRLNGGLIGYVLEFGLLAALIVAMVSKYMYLQKDKEASVAVQVKKFQEFVKANPGQPLLIVKKLWSLRHFWSFRHAVAYGAIYARQQKPGEVKREWLNWLISLRNQALGKTG
jgi:hypothetical protein